MAIRTEKLFDENESYPTKQECLKDKFINWAKHSALPWMQHNATYLEFSGAALGGFVLGITISKVYKMLNANRIQVDYSNEANSE